MPKSAPSCFNLFRTTPGIFGHQFQAIRCLSTRHTTYTLNTGAKIPAVGFGTFQDPDAQEEAVCTALKTGYRLIDTARIYHIEKQVGKGIKKSGVPREEVFIGTKLWCNDYHPEDVERAVDDSLRDLDTPYLDLILMHYPCTFARGTERFPRDANGKMIHGETTFVDTWKALEKVVKTGKVRAIGVSNFSKGEVERLLNETDTVKSYFLSSPRMLINNYSLLPFTRWSFTPTFNRRNSRNGTRSRAFISCSSVLLAT